MRKNENGLTLAYRVVMIVPSYPVGEQKFMLYPDPFNKQLLNANGIYYYPLLDSTNAEIRRLAEEGAPDDTVVLADAQSAGRGRRDRLWHSPPGKGIYFSILLRPPRIKPAAAAPITLVAAVAAARQLRETTGIKIAVKWPNDLLIGTKKVGGILTETRTNGPDLLYLVLGIGLNINHQIEDFPAELREYVTSLSLESSLTFERTALFLSVLENVRRNCRLFFKTGFAPFQPLWKEISATLGNTVELARPGEVLQGKAVDLDPAGALLIEDGRGRHHRITYGEIV